jgi:hypothetical protein
MVMVFAAQDAETPAGNPLAPDTPLLEIPVAPVVVWVIAVSGVFMQSVGAADAALAVLLEDTVTAVVPLGLGQPLTVATTVYVPAMAEVAEAETVGFCTEDEKPFGPVQE